jgi:hypothetical protein
MLARKFLQRLAVGRDRLIKFARAALAFPEGRECFAEIVLRRRPLERNALARKFLQRVTIGGDRLLQLGDTVRNAIDLALLRQSIWARCQKPYAQYRYERKTLRHRHTSLQLFRTVGIGRPAHRNSRSADLDANSAAATTGLDTRL